MSMKLVEELYTEEEEMAESNLQRVLSTQSVSVLEYRYREEGCFIGANLQILPRQDGRSYDFVNLVPDVVLFKGVNLSEEDKRNLKSWDLNQDNRPAPSLVIEICSDSTYKVDLNNKPRYYGQLGVKKYYSYDPRERTPESDRLIGWQYEADGLPHRIQPDHRGWLWSVELESWVAPAGPEIHLYDLNGQKRLTLMEATEQARIEAEQARLQAEQRLSEERLAKELERAAKEVERKARLAAELEIETEREARLAAELEMKAEREARLVAELEMKAKQQANEDLRQKLRERGIDPDSL